MTTAEGQTSPAYRGNRAQVRVARIVALEAVLDDLGKVADGKIAKMIGVPTGFVREYRVARGIEAFSGWSRGPKSTTVVEATGDTAVTAPPPKTPTAKVRAERERKVAAAASRLGMVADSTLAAELGVPVRFVSAARAERQIPRFRGWSRSATKTKTRKKTTTGVRAKAKARRERLVKSVVHRLGEDSDQLLARELGINAMYVAEARRERGIAVMRRKTVPADPPVAGLASADLMTSEVDNDVVPPRESVEPKVLWRVLYGAADAPTEGLVVGASLEAAAVVVEQTVGGQVLVLERMGEVW